jgi:membrane peptidoglycan carboxypeptidase
MRSSTNPIWAKPLEVRNGPGGSHRPVAVKTGTANDARDLATYGYLGPPKDPSQPALAVGVWMGNSDHSNPRTAKPAISLTAAAPLWHAFVRDVSAKMPVAGFPVPATSSRARSTRGPAGGPVRGPAQR